MIPEFVANPRPDLYKTGKWVALDFETSNKDKGSALAKENFLVLACWSTGQGAVTLQEKFAWGSEFDMQELLADISQCDFLIAQNGKFELQWLDRCGYDIGSKPIYDTMMGEWVLSGNRLWPLDLDSMARKYGAQVKSRLIKLLMGLGVSSEDIPRSLLLRYCQEDVRNTIIVMQGQLKAMQGTRLLPIVYTRCLATIALSDIEKHGVYLDSDAVQRAHEETTAELAQASKELSAMTGGINPASRPQMAEFLYDVLRFEEVKNPRTREPVRTATGLRGTSAPILAQLNAVTQEQKQFLELRQKEGKLRTAISKNLDFFLGVCKEYGSIFYGQIRQGVARTHRLASSGRALQFKMFPKPKSCQFQNFPNQYKKLIAARHAGWLVCEGDGAQLEFRVGGHLGNDDQIRHDIRNKEDVHTNTARALTAAGEPTSRRAAKAVTFKPMYGGTRGSDAVEAYVQFFAQRYHQLNTTQKSWAQQAFNDKYIETEWGMRYYFDDLKVGHKGNIIGQQKVFNYPIQGFATAEIIPIGLVFFWYRTRSADMIITNTVHDSIICEVPPWEIELFQTAIVQSLTTDVYSYLDKCYNVQFSLPLGVGIKMGSHWGTSAFSDEELEELMKPIRTLGYEPTVKEGEISVDVEYEY